MLNKRQRLTKRAFDAAFARGTRYHSPTMQLIYDNSDPEFHGAVVVGKKVYKQAVDRNRLRRRLYGALYRLHQTHQLTGTFILIAKPSAATVAPQELTETLTTLMAKVRRQ